MDVGMIVTFAGIIVAGLAGVLGVWMERDREAPPRWAWVFSAFIVVAMGIEMSHSVVQAAEDAKTEEAMARVLEKLTLVAAKGNNPALQSFVSAELAAQARSNPGVMEKLEKNVAAKGGDPKAIRKQAAQGRRTAAGLPAKKPSKAAVGKAGGKAGKAGGKAGKAGGKAGKAGGKAGKADGKAGKAGKAGGKADGKSGGKSGGKSDGKASQSRSDGKSGGKSDGKSGGKSDGKSGGKSDGKSGGKSDGKSGKSKG